MILEILINLITFQYNLQKYGQTKLKFKAFNIRQEFVCSTHKDVPFN